MQQGQASIEYLVLLVAVLFFFSIMLPPLQRSYALAFFAADVASAANFAEELQLKANEMNFLSDGSVFFLRARPVGKWVLQASGETLAIKVEADSLHSEKVFAVDFQQEIFFPETVLQKETVFLLKKDWGKLLLENA